MSVRKTLEDIEKTYRIKQQYRRTTTCSIHMSWIEGYDGYAVDHWPQCIGSSHIDPAAQSNISTIPLALDQIAEHTIIDTYKQRQSGCFRRLGLFHRQDEKQSHVAVKFYGFIKQVELTGFGNWNGAVQSASRAILSLEIEGRGCDQAFGPQLRFMENVRLHISRTLDSDKRTELGHSIQFQHVLFRKATPEDRAGTLDIPPGEDPLGKLARVSKFWRLRQKPSFCKRSGCSAIAQTTAMSYNVHDFVEVVAYPEIIFKDGRGHTRNRVQVCLALDTITRLYNESELLALQIPAALLQLTRYEEQTDGERTEPVEHETTVDQIHGRGVDTPTSQLRQHVNRSRVSYVIRNRTKREDATPRPEVRVIIESSIITLAVEHVPDVAKPVKHLLRVNVNMASNIFHSYAELFYAIEVTIPTMQYSPAVLATLNVYQLQVLSDRSRLDQQRAQRELRTRRRRMLSRFFTDPSRVVEILDRHHSVISGSFALEFLEGDNGWRANDVDVYVPFEEFDSVKGYFMNVEGYREDEDARTQRRNSSVTATQHHTSLEAVRRQNDVYVLPPVDTGICRVATLYKNGRKVDIIQNSCSSALYAITQFWSTLQMNYISAKGFCCAYPSLTLRRIGVINPVVQDRELLPRHFVDALIQKYQARGYQFYTRWYYFEGYGCHGYHIHALCPSTDRSFEDHYSLSGTFGSNRRPGTIGSSRGASVSTWKTLYAARQILFKECSLTIDEDGTRLQAFLDFLYDTPDAARAIRSFTLASGNYSTDVEAHIDLPKAYELVCRMPGLRKVTLYSIRWDGNPGGLFIENPHPRLHTIKLCYVAAADFTESPLELLRLSRKWRSIDLFDVWHPQFRRTQLIADHINCESITIQQCPFMRDGNYLLPYPWPVFASLQILRVEDILLVDVPMTRHIFRTAENDLRHFELGIPNIEIIHPISKWESLLRGLRKLCVLQTFTLSVPINRDNCVKEKDTKGTVGGHLEFVIQSILKLPPTLQAFKLRVALEDPQETVFLSWIPWKRLVRHFKTLPAFTAFALELTCVGGGEPIDRHQAIPALCAAFDFLPFTLGDPLHDLVLATNSQAAEEAILCWSGVAARSHCDL
ncbi:hypothetical protein NM688_g343 [Phlebia brevispora]|uniref:Uncharacterized protein n=1 Tax=Phlebia brevispora TaxID=194682 RepID=A0ACC1TEI0_9APHY|nr:hypothetical protein NM688_g343 [Phlebia brevispora]